MAEVKMELSEFKRLEKTEEDLREALKREKKNAKKIQQLEQEKIQALEENDKSVTIVTEVHKTELIMQRRSDMEISNYFARWIRRAVTDVNSHRDHFIVRRGADYTIDGNTLASLLAHELRRPNHFGMNNSDVDPSVLVDMFFEKKEVIGQSCPEQKTIIRKGLDEYIVQLKDELRSEMDEDTRRKLDNIPTLISSAKEAEAKRKEAVKESKELKLELGESQGLVEELEKQVKELSGKLDIANKSLESIDGLVKENPDVISRTKELLKTTSILKLKGTFRQLREIWNIS